MNTPIAISFPAAKIAFAGTQNAVMAHVVSSAHDLTARASPAPCAWLPSVSIVPPAPVIAIQSMFHIVAAIVIVVSASRDSFPQYTSCVAINNCCDPNCVMIGGQMCATARSSSRHHDARASSATSFVASRASRDSSGGIAR